ncbi:MAG: hypothetical protein ACJ72H_04160 [Candidatus Sulfotelmatobacter sp.]
MPQAVDSLTSVVEQLGDRLRDLESRIASLESFVIAERLPQPEARPTPTPLVARRASPPRRLPELESSARAFPTVGKAVLGFAGAFLLRALAESGSVPKLPVLIIAILYACFWMIWSARTNDRFASVTYAVTSTLILSPMLWEATVRFQSMPATASASILVAFIVLTLVLASRHDLQVIPWIATLASASTAVALIVGTRELIPLTLALLAIAAAVETSACLGHELTFRVIPAMAADFTLWLSLYILGSENVPEGYRSVAPSTLIAVCALLPAIYGIGVTFRMFVQRHRISIFEIAQLAASFGLAAFGIMRASHNAAAPALGVLFLLLAGISYWGTLSRFAAESHTRNRRVSATWAAALLVAGAFLLLPDNFQIPFLCAAALLTAVLYTRTAKLSLGLHASFYLAAAVSVSSLPSYVWNSLAGTVPASPDWRAWTVALSAALCYAVESRKEMDQGRRRLLWLVPAGIAAFTIAGWAVAATVRVASGQIELAASHLSMIRTVVICLLALVLGVASRRRHLELRWIAYAAVALGTLKLVLEDLRFGNPASLVVSFVFYGLILILLPRMTRTKQES